MDIKKICTELEDLFDIDVDKISKDVESYCSYLIDIVFYYKDHISNEYLYSMLCDELVSYHKKLFDEFEIYESEHEVIEQKIEYIKTGKTYVKKLVRRKE